MTGADAKAIAQYFTIAAVDGLPGAFPIRGRFPADLSEGKSGAIPTEARPAQLLEGIDEVRRWC